MIIYKWRDEVANDIPYPMASGHFTLVVALKYYTTRKICARIICLTSTREVTMLHNVNISHLRSSTHHTARTTRN